MDKKEQKELLVQIFKDLQAAGKIRTQGDFGLLLGVTRTYISRALNGDENALSPSLMSKAVQLYNELIKGEAPVLPSPASPERDEAAGGIFIPKETLALYESLARTAENLTAIVSRLMPGGLPLEGKKAGTSPD